MDLKKCPMCGGNRTIQTPDAHSFQMCPLCDGTGEDPGIERFFVYKFDVVMTANQLLQNQRIVIGGEAPFRIKILTRTKTGDFRIRLGDSAAQFYSSAGSGSGLNDRVRDACIFGDGQLPFLVVPHITIPPGGTINFDLEDVSGAGNTLHLAFIGAKVYPSQQ